VLRLWGVVCVLSCSASNSAAPVVQTAGGVGVCVLGL
jgi:hypothetical protein